MAETISIPLRAVNRPIRSTAYRFLLYCFYSSATSRLAGVIMFSTCPSVRSSVRLLLISSTTRYFGKEPILLQIGTSGLCHLYMGQRMIWYGQRFGGSGQFSRPRSKVKVTPKLDLETWRGHHSRPLRSSNSLIIIRIHLTKGMLARYANSKKKRTTETCIWKYTWLGKCKSRVLIWFNCYEIWNKKLSYRY